MIPEITFKEFVNNLFDYTQIPLEKRGWITAREDINFSYAYTWGEIEDYINRWLNKVPITQLDNEVNTAFNIMEKIVDYWYLINFNHEGGRVGYDDDDVCFDPYVTAKEYGDFELHTKLRELIYLKAKSRKLNYLKAKSRELDYLRANVKANLLKAKKINGKKVELKVFEDYLICETEKKQLLINKLEQLYKTATARDAFIIYSALEETGYILKRGRGRQEVYTAINKRFGKNWKNQNYQGHRNNISVNFDPEINNYIKFLKD